MAVTQDYIDKTNAALLEACPLASQDPDSVAAIKDKILTFYRELNFPPTELQVIQFAVPYEQALLKKKEEAEAKVRQRQEKAEARKKQREDDLKPASVLRAEANAELRQRNVPVETERFTPEKEYTQGEIDRMTDGEAKRVLFGIDNPNLNESKPDAEARKLYEKKLLKTRRNQDTPLKRALRREILEGLR
jgi:hypothetical protein